MKKLSILFAAAAISAAVSAQSVVIPKGMDSTNPGSTAFAWQNVGFRFQMLYDQAHFLDQGVNYPVTISRLQYRAAGGVTSPGAETYSGVTVQISSSPSDWSTASTTFATNQGSDNTTVFSGNVTCLPAAGTSPNTYIVDIPLATPFVYDPTAGLDLCIDVEAPTAPLPATVPVMASASSATHMARRIATTTIGSPTGGLSYFACVVMLDYTPLPNAALATKFGDGCVARAESFYELFTPGSYDLTTVPGRTNSILLTPTASGYSVTTGTHSWFSPSSPTLVLTDDSLSAALPLTFTFPYQGGSTTDIKICSNGFVWLDATQTASTFAGDVGLLLTQGARLAPLWHDMDPGAGGTVHFDVHPSGNIAYATWIGVPMFGVPASTTTMQVALYADGRIEYRWQDCVHGDGLVGWSKGGGARDGGSMDVSMSIPFVTETDTFPLVLEPLDRPKLGNTLNLEVRNIPTDVVLGVMNFGFTKYTIPYDLGTIGAPTCFMFASLEVDQSLAPTGTVEPYALLIPVDTNLIGGHMYMWPVMVSPSANVLGVITGNAVDLLFDIK